jgi:hypothetical protein
MLEYMLRTTDMKLEEMIEDKVEYNCIDLDVNIEPLIKKEQPLNLSPSRLTELSVKPLEYPSIV